MFIPYPLPKRVLTGPSYEVGWKNKNKKPRGMSKGHFHQILLLVQAPEPVPRAEQRRRAHEVPDRTGRNGARTSGARQTRHLAVIQYSQHSTAVNDNSCHFYYIMAFCQKIVGHPNMAQARANGTKDSNLRFVWFNFDPYPHGHGSKSKS